MSCLCSPLLPTPSSPAHAAVFSGYLGIDPHSADDSFTADGYFRTGDLACVTDTGFLQIVDRAKDMLLVGGENVYSSEVERVLLSHPAIAEAAVVGVPDPVMGDQVRAVVVARRDESAPKEWEDAMTGDGRSEGAALSRSSVTAHCRARLAGFKCPVAVYEAGSLPKTASGKVKKGEVKEAVMRKMLEEEERRRKALERREEVRASKRLGDCLFPSCRSRLGDSVSDLSFACLRPSHPISHPMSYDAARAQSQ